MLKQKQNARIQKALMLAVLVTSVLSAPLAIPLAHAGGSDDLRIKEITIRVQVAGDHVVVEGKQLQGELLTHTLDVEARCDRTGSADGSLERFTIDSASGPHPGKFSKTVQLNFKKSEQFKGFRVPGVPLGRTTEATIASATDPYVLDRKEWRRS
jgi:hypothetical protein